MGFKDAIVASVVRPIVGLAESGIQHARAVSRETIHRELYSVRVVPPSTSSIPAPSNVTNSTAGGVAWAHAAAVSPRHRERSTGAVV